MRRLSSVFVLALLPLAGGCSCLTNGQADLRTVPLRGLPGSLASTAAHAGSGPVIGPARLTAAPASPAGPREGSLFAALDEAAPEPAAQAVAYRDPQRAFCLACLIAGGGHFYTGETVKGAALMGAAAAGLIGGFVLSGDGGDEFGDCVYNPETHECEPAGGNTPLLIGAGIAAASWIYGIVDSRPSAVRMNARNGLQVGQALVEPRPWLGMRQGGLGAGLNFRVTW